MNTNLGMIILLSALGILGFILYGYLCMMIYYIGKYFNERSKKETVMTNRLLNTPLIKDVSFLDKVDATVCLLNLINTLIDGEITKMLEPLARLKVKYEMKNMDNDIRTISTKIYEGLKKEENFGNYSILVTDEFVMKHITEEVSGRILVRTFAYNANGTVYPSMNK